MFLFHFSHVLDMEAEIKGGLWLFDNHLMIVERVKLRVKIENNPLFQDES